MKIWLSTMEFAGIAEAGGVKDVSYSLAKGYSAAGCDVTVFIPAFGCASFGKVKKLKRDSISEVKIPIGEKETEISYSTAVLEKSSIKVVFVNHPSFEEKRAVYVYTEEDEKLNPRHKRGKGHDDCLFLDALFSKAVCAYANYISPEEYPDIVHCQDASTAVLPCYATFGYKNCFSLSKFVVTIHNAGPAYHHDFMSIGQASFYTGLSYSVLNRAQNGFRVEPFLLASICAKLTTVSTFYAEELCNPENADATDGLSVLFHKNNIQIEGITNGIDYSVYRPERKSISMLPHSYSPRRKWLLGKQLNRNFLLKLSHSDSSGKTEKSKYMKDIVRYGFMREDKIGKNPVYFMYHGRIAWQKGISLLLESIPFILQKYQHARFFIAGQGDPKIEEDIKQIASTYLGKVVFFNGYNAPISRLVAAASDFAVLPSFFEPCCLEDFISQIFGTLPIAHATGGLKKIIDGKTGFLFEDNSAESLLSAVDRAMELYENKKSHKKMISWTVKYICEEYSWKNVIEKKYLKFFKNI